MDADVGDPRLSDLLGTRSSRSDHAVLIGFPSDEGVRINGGRPGSAKAPDLIRQALGRMTPDARDFDRFVDVVSNGIDAGDVPVTGHVRRDQETLGRVVAEHIAPGHIPIIIGGGHETSFGHFRGYVQLGREVSIVNLDAHPDVRPLRDENGHSGSPFWQALSDPAGRCTSYAVVGLQPQSVAADHLAFIAANGGRWIWSDDLTVPQLSDLFAGLSGDAMVSFDMDAVGSAWAPGVSAPSPLGVEPGLWLRAAYLAGICPAVRSIDLCEVNPSFDVDGRTVRLAALTLWHFLRGLASREGRGGTRIASKGPWK